MKDLRDQVKQRLTADYVFKTVEGQQPLPSGWIKARCPFHTDKHPSFAFNPSTLAWACFAGCGKGDAFTFLMNIWGMDFKETLHRAAFDLGIVSKDKKPPIPEELVQGWADVLAQDEFLFHGLQDKRGLTEETLHKHQIGWWAEQKRVTIPIRDEKGALVNVRLYNSKKKKWKMLNYTDGDWRYGSPIRIYGADELAANPGKPVILAEGEWDALLLRQEGMFAVSTTGGCKSWKNEWSALFANRDLTVIYDCDAEGRKAVEETVLPALSPALSVDDIKSLKIIWLPLEGSKDEKDITDYLVKLGHSADDLKRLIQEAEPFTPGFIRPSIITSNRQLRDVVVDAESAIIASNTPPQVFLRDQKLAKIKFNDNGNPPGIQVITKEMFLPRLSQTADFFRRTNAGGLLNVDPPPNVIKSIVAVPPELPPLNSVATAPIITPSGTILKQSGYHPELAVWIELPPELEKLKIPDKPTPQEVKTARDALLEVFIDFPFDCDASRTHAMVFLLVPFVRRLIKGPTPLHLVSASVPAAGKTLLLQAASAIFLGIEPGTSTFPTSDNEEARKRITASLLSGVSHVLFDNADPGKGKYSKGNTELDSPPLAAVLTTQYWTDRFLGKSMNVSAYNYVIWSMTANNPVFSRELTRRCASTRLVPLVEDPGDRTGFKHKPLVPWVLTERPRLICAALTIIRAWFNAGCPKGKGAPLASYESWSEIMGGILQVAGIEGFLENRGALRDTMDEERTVWREFVRQWLERFEERAVTVAELNGMCDAHNIMSDFRGPGEEHSQIITFGKALKKQRDRIYLGHMIIAHRKRKIEYSLRRIENENVLSDTQNSASTSQTADVAGVSDDEGKLPFQEAKRQIAGVAGVDDLKNAKSPQNGELQELQEVQVLSPSLISNVGVPVGKECVTGEASMTTPATPATPAESPISAEFGPNDAMPNQGGIKGESVAYLNTSSLEIVSTSGMSLQEKYKLATTGNCTPLTVKLAREIVTGYEGQEVDAKKRARLDELTRWLEKNAESS